MSQFFREKGTNRYFDWLQVDIKKDRYNYRLGDRMIDIITDTIIDNNIGRNFCRDKDRKKGTNRYGDREINLIFDWQQIDRKKDRYNYGLIFSLV